VFNERGLDVSLDEIARHAGVGVGTVYRRFRTKEELIEALFLDRLDSVAAIADEAYANPDAWCGLVSFMERMAEIMAGDLGLRQMLMYATYGRDLVAIARQRNEPLVGRLVERAQAADRHPVHRLHTDRGGAPGVRRQSRHLAPVPDPGPRRHAARTRGRHAAPGAGYAARRDGEEHAAGRSAAPLTLSADLRPIPANPRNRQNDLHLHVHVQSVNE
jgi:AcrR family transcriptional regulator